MPALGANGMAGGPSSAPKYAPPKPPPAPPSNLFGAVAHAIARTAPAVTRAASSASTPHQAAPAQSGRLFQGSPATQKLAVAFASRARGNNRLSSTPQQNATLLQQARADWTAMQAKGLLPPGHTLPQFVLESKGLGPRGSLGAALTSFMTPGKVHFGPGVGAAASNPNSRYNGFARWVPIHEMAHTMQNQAALGGDMGLREGGAQAFTDIVAPQVLPRGTRYPGNGRYSDYVRQQFAREPHSWITRGQFDPQATAPTVNMPGTASFSGAIGRVGQLAGNATRFTGAKSAEAAMQVALRRKGRYL